MARQLRVGGDLYVVPDLNTARSDRRAKLERQAAYLAWIVQPREERDPPTKTAMAEALGCTIQTLLAYERDPDFSAAVRDRLGQAFRTEHLPRLFDSLYATAVDSSNPRQVTAARTLLEWFGRAQAATSGLADMSVEELEKVAEGAPA